MKKTLIAIMGIAMAVAMVVIPVKETKAASQDYILTQQALDLLNTAQRELDDAYRAKDDAQRRVDSLRNRGIGGDELNNAYRDLDDCYTRIGRKEDKVNKARYIVDFTKSRSSSEIFLAGMQEKFKNQASLKPMQDRIDGAKAIASAQLTQVQIIQQAIQSQTELAKVNPAIFEQIQQLNASYQQELAQYQQEQAAIQELQTQYNTFAATMPMPTAEDYMKLSEIRTDFAYACDMFDQACNE